MPAPAPTAVAHAIVHDRRAIAAERDRQQQAEQQSTRENRDRRAKIIFAARRVGASSSQSSSHLSQRMPGSRRAAHRVVVRTVRTASPARWRSRDTRASAYQ